MKKNLASFAFDKVKSGQILKHYIEESPYSQRQIAHLIGMTEDMLQNVLRGANREISLERIAKICIVTAHSISEFIHQLMEGEDIDFQAEFDVFCPPPSVNLADSSVGFAESSANLADSAAPGSVSVRKVEAVVRETEMVMEEKSIHPALSPEILSFLRLDRAEQAQRNNDLHEQYALRIIDQYKSQIQQLDHSRQITIDHYEDRVALLVKEHERHVQDLKEFHRETIARMEDDRKRTVEFLKAENVRQRKWIVRLGVILGVETAAIVGLFLYDALNRNVGWFRGLFTDFSGSFIDSFRS